MSDKKRISIFGKKKSGSKVAQKVSSDDLALPTITTQPVKKGLSASGQVLIRPRPPAASGPSPRGRRPPPVRVQEAPPMRRQPPPRAGGPGPVMRLPSPNRQGRSATVCIGGDGTPGDIPAFAKQAAPAEPQAAPPVPTKPSIPQKPALPPKPSFTAETDPTSPPHVPKKTEQVSAALDVAMPAGTTWKRGAEAEAIMKLLQMEAMKMAEPSDGGRKTIQVQRPPTPPKQEDILVIGVPDELVAPEQLKKTFDQELTAGVLSVLEEHLEWFKNSWAAEAKEGKAAARAALQSHIWDALAAKGVAVEAKLKNLSLVLDDDQLDAVTMTRMTLDSRTKKVVKVMQTVGEKLAASDSSATPWEDVIRGAVDVLKKILDAITDPIRHIKQLSYVTSIVQTLHKYLDQVNTAGKPIESTLGAAASYRDPAHMHHVMSDTLTRTTQRLQILFIQLTNTIDGIDAETGILLHRKLMDVLANVRLTSHTLQQAVNELATAQLLCERSQGEEKAVSSPRVLMKSKSKKSDEPTLWKCVEPGASPPSDKEKGTLDELVWLLTSTTMMDNDFIHTFIITYESFTTPEVLFGKLMERYDVPKKQRCKPSEDKKQVQLRVCIALKYWIEHEASKLEESVLSDLTDFIDNRLVQDGQGSLSGLLRNALNQATAEEAKAQKVMKFDLATLACTFSQTDMFMLSPVGEIAEQLTLISWQIFSRVRSSELLNQCWNKPKSHHLAPNVRQMIARFNDVSYWVTYMITAQEKVAVRARVMGKMIKLATLLFEMQNFDGLMGIIAGLQQSSNSRLKHTKSLLDDKMVEEFKKLNEMMQPQSSWKLYRDHLRSVHPPAIPYMGVYLTDLTFIEDGNPDTRTDAAGRQLINFKKREMVHRVIQEMQDLQSVDYGASFDTFEVQEPLYSYLLELPFLEENQTYSLSLEREPRNTPIEAIL